MLARAQKLAEKQLAALQKKALTAMRQQLDAEISRLEDLMSRNPHVRPEEVAALVDQRESLAAAIQSAVVRLDAVRLILRLK
jgi:ATP-dependent helicase HepA